MTDATTSGAAGAAGGERRLAILLAMAMFVLVVDTSLMNVSIAAVVGDLDTTVSGVQSAIALEALVSAAFILIGSKVGDLIGRKRAYVLGLLGYAIGALAMALSQSLTAVIVFWAVIGGLGASLLLPAMQSLIHGNFEGGAGSRPTRGRCRGRHRRRGGTPARRFHHDLSVVAHRVPARGRDHRDRPERHPARAGRAVHGRTPRRCRRCGAVRAGDGRHRARHPGVAGGRRGRRCAHGHRCGRLAALAYWLVRRKREGKPVLLDPDLFRAPLFRFGISGQTLQQIALGGMMISLPIYLQMVLEYNAMEAGLSLAPLSLSMFAMALLASKKAGQRRPSSIIRLGFTLLTAGTVLLIPLVPRVDSGWYLVVPLLIAGSGLGLLVSQLNNYTLSPISEERVSEAAGGTRPAGRSACRSGWPSPA